MTISGSSGPAGECGLREAKGRGGRGRWRETRESDPVHLAHPHQMAPPPQQQQITLGQILRAQYTDPESWAANKVVLTAFGTFAAAVAAIAAFGDMLVPTF
ncbi:hypothetical protein RTBOTA2_003446 [Rhodotorula toruloides]|nr:hypothetical protein RTBOTA2_003446 [Rhodotorula toruloides]